MFDRMVLVGRVARGAASVLGLAVVLVGCGHGGADPAARGGSANPDAGGAGIGAGTGTTTVRPDNGSATSTGIVQIDATPVRDGQVSVVVTLAGGKGASTSVAAEVVVPSEKARPATTQDLSDATVGTDSNDAGAHRIGLCWYARADLGLRWVVPVTLRL